MYAKATAEAAILQPALLAMQANFELKYSKAHMAELVKFLAGIKYEVVDAMPMKLPMKAANSDETMANSFALDCYRMSGDEEVPADPVYKPEYTSSKDELYERISHNMQMETAYSGHLQLTKDIVAKRYAKDDEGVCTGIGSDQEVQERAVKMFKSV